MASCPLACLRQQARRGRLLAHGCMPGPAEAEARRPGRLDSPPGRPRSRFVPWDAEAWRLGVGAPRRKGPALRQNRLIQPCSDRGSALSLGRAPLPWLVRAGGKLRLPRRLRATGPVLAGLGFGLDGGVRGSSEPAAPPASPAALAGVPAAQPRLPKGRHSARSLSAAA